MKEGIRKRRRSFYRGRLSLQEQPGRARAEGGRGPLRDSDGLLVFGLKAVLLALPGLVLLSMIEPSGLLLRKVLLRGSPVLWVAWAILCFWAGLSAAELAERSGCKALASGNNEAYFSVLGLVNCASAVGLLWLAGGLG